MSNTTWGWTSYDIDNPDGDNYCSQTDVHSDGTVHRYDSTNGSFANGHGHDGYKNMDSFFSGEKESWSRSSNDSRSAGRSWTDRH